METMELPLAVAKPHHCLMAYRYEGREVFAVLPSGETWFEEGWNPKRLVEALYSQSFYYVRANDMLKVRDNRRMYGLHHGIEATVRDRQGRPWLSARGKTETEFVRKLAAVYREEYTQVLLNGITTFNDPQQRVVAQLVVFREPGTAFPQPVVLAFNPEDAARREPARSARDLKYVENLADTPFGEVWQDPEARILWMGVRGGRLVHQYFNGWMCVIAEWVRKAREKGTLTAEVLTTYLNRADCFGTREDVKQHAIDLLPYLLKEKEFQWIVRGPREGDEDESGEG